ncbi:MAG TPA: DUF4920 domain-containing protein [Chitinophagales bacterium]|jgi:hypothetical protein|nr:DUF4920 domain-containing protein [Chitinophagales bacterium]HQW80032.1 DUF4920 domain-containing protein [Chitinophagales bacterium]HRB18589.1 DUF4920 domain-containing protein [Chitinophagales bacterium]HRB66466.1 DUF4920 domain-containing protein [Chitinophagales bacterium]HRB69113.1 DUF4920 domain-containing protein [Chitinophagales bacterium]
MKNILFLSILSLILSACNSTSNQLGEKFTAQKTITVDEVKVQLKSSARLNNIQIEGNIDKSCMGEGCWFTIKDKEGTEVLFDVQDKKFRVPTNSPGKTVIVLADAVNDSSVEQQFNLLVKGLMFK